MFVMLPARLLFHLMSLKELASASENAGLENSNYNAFCNIHVLQCRMSNSLVVDV